MNDVDDQIRRGLAVLASRIEPACDPDEVVAGLHRTSTRPSRRPLLVVAAAVAVILIVAGVLTATRPGPVDVLQVGSSTSIAGSDRTAAPPTQPGLWRELPPGPFDGLRPQVVLWTGQRLIVWRGESIAGKTDPRIDRTASFDLATRTWSQLPEDPLGGTTHVVSLSGHPGGVFANGEAFFWSGDGMVAWNPQSSTWRAPTQPPKALTSTSVWSGFEIMFPLDGLAYNPAEDHWRTIARPSDALITAGAGTPGMLWTNGQIIVVDATAGIYDNATDTWHEFPAPPTSSWDGFFVTMFLLDGKIVAVDGQNHAGLLDAAAHTWTPDAEARPPIPPCERAPTIIPFGDELFAETCGVAARRKPAGRWRNVPAPPGPVISTGDSLLSYGYGPAGTGLSICEPGG